MRKVFFALLILIGLYGVSLLVRASQAESHAETYLEVALLDIAKPWSVEKLTARASFGFREKANLKPSDIVRLANNDLGSLVKIIGKPDCNLQQGTDSISDGMRTFAVCEVQGEFEKTTVVLKIALEDDGNWREGEWKIHHFISVK